MAWGLLLSSLRLQRLSGSSLEQAGVCAPGLLTSVPETKGDPEGSVMSPGALPPVFGQPDDIRVRYDEAAAKLAWRRTVDLLKKHLAERPVR
jgi:hypothetical protein